MDWIYTNYAGIDLGCPLSQMGYNLKNNVMIWSKSLYPRVYIINYFASDHRPKIYMYDIYNSLNEN